jgi:Holliday junction resolvase RusA-like endonuclease
MIQIVLAGEPIGKGRPRFSRASGTVYTPEKTARFEERLGWAAQQTMRGTPLFEGPLIVHLHAHMSIPASKPKKWKAGALAGEIRPTKKPDADNFAKVLDAMNKVVWVDDSQIVQLIVEKWFSPEPKLIVTVQSWQKAGLFD